MFLDVYQDNIASIENITERLLTLHERAQAHIETKYAMDSFEQLKKYNKKEMLQTFMWLQEVFIDNTNFSSNQFRMLLKPIIYFFCCN